MTLPNKNKLIFNFNQCSSWEEKYLYIIELGEKIPIISSDLRHSKNMIAGCQSQVWIKITPNPDSTVVFEGDSNSVIVKGLIAIIFILYQNLSMSDIIILDIKYWFNQLSLTQHITPTRSQGIEAVIKSIHRSIKILSKNT
ncbi:cysteine desulfuration protein SufE [Candidatus Pantoea edessiphila]|uniref:Cysteine desulfuration protein SufE n=1 Tax=Candidatus Pantoea edessiphila TaxID=2044610 RepID=A0A2P5T0S0_9GAMM|nr:cysteine desulfuration protein SufE [Candidatus Pantoea edessiphila]PPI88142.1 cysteine desulfuration protein SufE [Candidatus Pantoea edessiphila]